MMRIFGFCSMVFAVNAVFAAVDVSFVSISQAWPWSTETKFVYKLSGTQNEPHDIVISVLKDGKVLDVAPESFSGERYGITDEQEHCIKWYPERAGIANLEKAEELSFKIEAKSTVAYKYLVLDLSEGSGPDAEYPSYFLEDIPEGGWSDEYKTTKLVLRRCEPGTFLIGSPADERNHAGSGASTEVQAEVTFTNHFYLGVFEMTVKQYKLIAGTNICYAAADGSVVVDDANPLLPATGLRYHELRGHGISSKPWPTSVVPDEGSLMALIRKRVKLPSTVPSGWVFDLPTEAQWEYACRAGTTTAWNNGTSQNPSSDSSSASDPNLALLGWYRDNSSSVRHAVGGKLENAWGFFDMHGNASEYVLEGCTNEQIPTGVEPRNVTGARNSGLARRAKGGAFCGSYAHCRSGSRMEIWNMYTTDVRHNVSSGFAMGVRLCLHYEP